MTPLVRFNPLLAPLMRLALGAATAPEADVVQAAETEKVRPPAFLPGMLDRITGTDEHSVLEDHLAAIHEREVTHAPVLRRVYRDALVGRSGFATWRHVERYGRGRRLRDAVQSLARVPVLRYCHSYVSWRYFGHWLTDAIPSALIDTDRGDLWMPPDPSWGHAQSYLELLGLSVVTAPLVRADRLIVYQDFGQGSHKQARYGYIRNRIHKLFGTRGSSLRVYLRRGRTGALRYIANESGLVDELAARDWRIIDVATTGVEELQRALCGAKTVVSIDGSHLDHAHLTLRAGGTMVILMPQDRFTSRQIGPCRGHHVSPGLVVLNGTRTQGYYTDVSEVLKTVDLAEARAGHIA